ncbi:hypothetical protein [Stenotrophomonas sp. CFBP 13718]|uniref:hypothetical protein n=1 Tax=Stenotrophomonas sp. CFBP 13718 TaxID=2775304 RepID=UPI00177FC7EB|nr:hypothetical protein [Stenotrophomonas sp. CFBP 13718]
MRRSLLPCAVLLLLTACHSETAMNQEIATAEQDVEQGGRGLAKLNPAPRQAYQFVLKIDDAPGPFTVVNGTAQYDVVNEQECGRIVPATGRAGRITSKEPVELKKISDTEYQGTVYLDRMLDEDYYDRGVCQWKFSGAGATLKATGAEGETRFVSFIDADRFVKGERETQHYADLGYPRDEMDNYADYGKDAPEGFKPELRDALFSVTLTGKEARS